MPQLRIDNVLITNVLQKTVILSLWPRQLKSFAESVKELARMYDGYAFPYGFRHDGVRFSTENRCIYDWKVLY